MVRRSDVLLAEIRDHFEANLEKAKSSSNWPELIKEFYEHTDDFKDLFSRKMVKAAGPLAKKLAKKYPKVFTDLPADLASILVNVITALELIELSHKYGSKKVLGVFAADSVIWTLISSTGQAGVFEWLLGQAGVESDKIREGIELMNEIDSLKSQTLKNALAGLLIVYIVGEYIIPNLVPPGP